MRQQPSLASEGIVLSPIGFPEKEIEDSFRYKVELVTCSSILVALYVAFFPAIGLASEMLGFTILRAASVFPPSEPIEAYVRVGAFGGFAAILTLVALLQIRAMELVMEKGAAEGRHQAVWKLFGLIHSKTLALTFGLLTGLLGQSGLPQGRVPSARHAVLAGLVGSVVLVAVTSLFQGVLFIALRHRRTFPAPVFYVDLPHPVHVDLFANYFWPVPPAADPKEMYYAQQQHAITMMPPKPSSIHSSTGSGSGTEHYLSMPDLPFHTTAEPA